jgi:hypothetical protein
MAGSYGKDVGFCWMQANFHGQIWKLFQFYLPLWIVIAFNVYSYVTVYRIVKTIMRLLESSSDNYDAVAEAKR